MSAFIVSHDHIDALMTFAVNHRVGYYANGQHVAIVPFNVTEVGTILLTENERSVRERYPDCEDDLPGKVTEVGGDAVPYGFKVYAPFIHGAPGKVAIQVLKACQCFDYQACETDDYEASVAHSIIGAIKSAAVHALPGYDNAKWEINRDPGDTGQIHYLGVR